MGLHSRLKSLLFVGSLTVIMSIYAVTYMASNRLKKPAVEQLVDSSTISHLTKDSNVHVNKASIVSTFEHLNQRHSVISDRIINPTASPSSVIKQLKNRHPLKVIHTQETTEQHSSITPALPKTTSAKVQTEETYSSRNNSILSKRKEAFRKRLAEERAKRLGKRLPRVSSNRHIHRPYPRPIPVPAELNPNDIEQNPQMIIILAYMHTGSTYLGSIFQNHPDTFYEYEPLRSLQAETKNGQNIKFLNGTMRLLNGSRIDPTLGAWAVQNMLQCAHESLDITTLFKFYFNLDNRVMRDTSPYFGCLRVRRWYDTARATTSRRQAIAKTVFFSPAATARIKHCLPHILNKCKTSKIRVSKFIRMSMDMGEHLLHQLPNLKVIHLIRDPRAMMDSQVRKGDMGTRNIKIFNEETKGMCARMLADFRLKERLKQRFPDRIVTVQYESILEYPVQTVDSLFKFTGLPFSDTDRLFVEEGSLKANMTVATRESVWKRHLDQIHLHIINQHCSNVLEELGYKFYDSIDDIRKPWNPTYTLDAIYSTKRPPSR